MNSMMMHGRNNGKKLMTVTIVKHAFEIIHLLTGEVSQSKRKIFLSACPSNKHYIKFGCPIVQKVLLKTQNNWAFNVFNHIIILVNIIVLDLSLKWRS